MITRQKQQHKNHDASLDVSSSSSLNSVVPRMPILQNWMFKLVSATPSSNETRDLYVLSLESESGVQVDLDYNNESQFQLRAGLAVQLLVMEQLTNENLENFDQLDEQWQLPKTTCILSGRVAECKPDVVLISCGGLAVKLTMMKPTVHATGGPVQATVQAVNTNVRLHQVVSLILIFEQ